MSNEAAERLYALIERGGDRIALRVNVNLALADERKATVERIRAATTAKRGSIDGYQGDDWFVDPEGNMIFMDDLAAILDAEAAR